MFQGSKMSGRITQRVASGLMLAACALGGVGGALAIEMNAELKKVVEGARAEGRLAVEAPPTLFGGSEGVTAATDWMRREFGLSIRGSYSPNPNFRQIIAKIYTELQANQKASSDLFIGTVTQVEPMLEKGIFRRVAWQALLPGRITPAVMEADGRALRVLTRIPGILYNKQRLPQIAQVQSMNDLLKPEFKGKITTNSFLGGFDVLIANWGYEKTAQYVSRLSSHIGGLVECGSGERIASGEILALALDCAGTEHFQTRFKGVLDLHTVPDAAQRRYNYLTIPTNSGSPNAAILYGLFFSSVEGQAWNRNRNDGDLDLYPESTLRQTVAAIEKQGYKFTDATLEWAAKNRQIPAQHIALIKLIERK